MYSLAKYWVWYAKLYCAWRSFLQNWDRRMVNKLYYYYYEGHARMWMLFKIPQNRRHFFLSFYLTLLLPCLPHLTWKTINKSAKLETTKVKLFCPLCMSPWKDSIKLHTTESRFVTGPSNILFAGVFVCTFQPGNVTGWGNKAVNWETPAEYTVYCTGSFFFNSSLSTERP